VPQTTGGTRSPRMAASGLWDSAHDHGSANAGAIWPRPRTRVCRRVHVGVLEARDGGMETVQEMGRKTGENRTIKMSIIIIILIFRVQVIQIFYIFLLVNA